MYKKSKRFFSNVYMLNDYNKMPDHHAFSRIFTSIKYLLKTGIRTDISNHRVASLLLIKDRSFATKMQTIFFLYKKKLFYN